MNTAFRRVSSITSRRTFASAVSASKSTVGFRPKSSKEVWLGDTGAYPVMATIALGLLFTSSVIVWSSFSNNDARWGDVSRKSLFRGDMAKEYQHPVKPAHH